MSFEGSELLQPDRWLCKVPVELLLEFPVTLAPLRWTPLHLAFNPSPWMILLNASKIKICFLTVKDVSFQFLRGKFWISYAHVFFAPTHLLSTFLGHFFAHFIFLMLTSGWTEELGPRDKHALRPYWLNPAGIQTLGKSTTHITPVSLDYLSWARAEEACFWCSDYWRIATDVGLLMRCYLHATIDMPLLTLCCWCTATDVPQLAHCYWRNHCWCTATDTPHCWHIGTDTPLLMRCYWHIALLL